MPRFRHILLAFALLAFFATFVIWPILHVVHVGFTNKTGGFTFAYVALVLHDPLLLRGLLNAALVAVLVTLLSLLIALPLALLSVRCDFPGRGLLSALLLAPLVLPPFVGALGLRLILARFGPLTQIALVLGLHAPLGIDWLGHYKLLSIVILEALHLYPIALLNLQASLANVDPQLEQAAANLGARPWKIFKRITLPLARPGLLAGATLVLIWSFTELGTPLMLDFYTITPVQIFQRLSDVADNPLPYALVVVMLIASALLYTTGKLAVGRTASAAVTRSGSAASPRRLRGLPALAAIAAFVFVIALAVLPHCAVVLTSLSSTAGWYKSLLPAHLTTMHYGQILSDELTLPSIARSLEYAALATLVALIVGIGVGVIVARSNLPGRGLIDALAMLPLAVPGLVLAFGYLAISVWLRAKLGGAGHGGWLAHILDVQESPLLFLVIAYAARRLPYVVRSVVAGLQQTPVDLELAAANLGATRARVLRRITLPLILANLIAGALLALAFAMLEVSDSLVLAQRREYFPITRAIWEFSQRLGDGLYIASALGVWAMAFLALTLMGAHALLGKKMGALFKV